jgi:DtxR family transcriptional regulator, Mn-dependent transcriptional regulator
MPTITVENYVKQIYLEQQRCPGKLVALGALAGTMSVVPGTVTTMVKSLADAGLAAYEPRQGVKLTRKGEKLALSMLRRHRLIELFLIQVLNVDWSEVHAEAEELEHALSDRLIERIDDFLGNPRFDPHGDPIPDATGAVHDHSSKPLSTVAPHSRMTVVRVLDQDQAFLSFVARHGMKPGASVTVLETDPAAESVTVQPDGHGRVVLALSAASKLLVAAHAGRG